MTGPLTWSLSLENYCCLEMHDWPFNLELELGSFPVPVDRAGERGGGHLRTHGGQPASSGNTPSFHGKLPSTL